MTVRWRRGHDLRRAGWPWCRPDRRRSGKCDLLRFVPGWLVIGLLLACYSGLWVPCRAPAGRLAGLRPLSPHDSSAPSWPAVGPRTVRVGGLAWSADDRPHEPTGRAFCERTCRLSSALQATLPPPARAIRPVPFSVTGLTHDAGKLFSSLLDSDDGLIPDEEWSRDYPARRRTGARVGLSRHREGRLGAFLCRNNASLLILAESGRD
jgi:hypothetical protein